MAIEFLGPKLFERDAQGGLATRVGTLFPRHRVLVTLPGIHASQRTAFIDHLNRRRAAEGQPPLPPDDEHRETVLSVDLFFDHGEILIRPDPGNMDLAFEGDELLQELASKRQIRYLFVFDPKVQRRIKERGECWRISPLPHSHGEMRQLIQEAKAAIRLRPIYYYSRAGGTRYVTCHEFSLLEALPSAELAAQLQEIADHGQRRNRLGNSEVDFFAADPLRFSVRDCAGVDFASLPDAGLRAKFAELRDRFRAAVPADLREDDLRLETWRNRLFTALVSHPNETLADEVLRGLSPEFFLQIEWLPGGRFEEGEFIVDSVFDEAEQHPEDAALQHLCDFKARGFIFNFVREHGDLEYINLGRVVHSLSLRRPSEGRRDVYIAELKPRSSPAPIVRFMRLLKWGTREHLNEGEDLFRAIMESEDYVDFVLDRRLGCRQLGMNLPPRIVIRRVGELYDGPRAEFRGQVIRATYSERDYIQGIATDKLPAAKLVNPLYSERLARLLGRAAASNIIVGRTYDLGSTVIFDDGDEVIIEDSQGLPAELIVGDHSGAFGEYERPLVEFARAYAQPVNTRVAAVPKPREFALAYLDAFREWLLHVQGDYRKRRRAFDHLFRHCKIDPAGSFGYRWLCVLQRLDATDAEQLVAAMRGHITVLAPPKGG